MDSRGRGLCLIHTGLVAIAMAIGPSRARAPESEVLIWVLLPVEFHLT